MWMCSDSLLGVLLYLKMGPSQRIRAARLNLGGAWMPMRMPDVTSSLCGRMSSLCGRMCQLLTLILFACMYASNGGVPASDKGLRLAGMT